MPNQETNVKTLKINRMSKEQYDAATKNPNELYLIPDTTDIDIAAHNSDNTAHSAAFTNRIDNSSITMNSSSKMQASGVKDVRTSNTLKTWTGTRAQYEAIATKDANTLYNITDDTDTTASLLDLLYPVGAVYISTTNVCPLATLGIGTWEEETCRILVDKKAPTSSDLRWYNLYSDGWCEQGGEVAAQTNTYNTSPVTLLKSYSSTDYYLSIMSATDSVSTDFSNTSSTTVFALAHRTGYTNKTASGFTVGVRYGVRWFTNGYTSITTNHKQWRRTA